MSGNDVRAHGLLRATRIVAIAIVPFLVAAAFLLFFFPTRSGELFAWQIDPPLTAYLLASAYVGGIWFFGGVAVQRRWSRVRHGFPAVVVFAGALLVATLLHLDRFSANLSFATWITLYVTTPFVVAAVAWLQRRSDDGTRDDADVRIPRALRTAVLLVGAAALLTGAVIFFAPQLVIPYWGWDLTPLTAQVIGAVLSLTGVVAARMLRDDRWSAFRLLFQSQLLSLLAIVLSLAVAHDDLRWERPAAAGFVLLVGIAFVGYGALYVVMQRRAKPA